MIEIVLKDHTPAFMEALLSDSPDIRAKIVFEDGVVIRDTDDLQEMTIKDSIYNDNFIGTFQKRPATIKMINYDAKYDLIDKKFNIFLGVGYDDNGNYTVEYEDMGTYVCYKTSDYKTEIELEIEAYDISYLFEAPYQRSIQTFPTTVSNYLSVICDAVNIDLATTSFPNSDMILLEQPFLEEGSSYRTAISMVAEASGGYARMGHDNKLYIEFFNSGKVYEIGDYSDLKEEKEIGPFNVVVLGRSPQEDNIFYPTELPEKPLEYRIDNNQILDQHRETTITAIYLLVNGFKYRPMEIEVVGNPLVQAGHSISYLDLNDVEVVNPVFEHILEYNGALISKYNTYQQSETSTNYKYAGTIEKRLTNTEIIVDKNNNEIKAIINQQNEMGDQLSQLTQRLDGFEFVVQESGNLNLISNSVGWADTKFWELTENGEVKINQSSDLQDRSTSKSGFDLTNITMSQVIQCKPNTQYSLCAVMENIANLNAHLKIINGTEELYLFNTGDIIDWERYDLTFLSTSNTITVEMYSEGRNLTITDLVLAEGELIQSWFPGANEIYTANVLIDRDGISVYNTATETRTVINANEFAIYSGLGKTISVNRDLTILQRVEITTGLYIGRLRFDVNPDGVDATIMD